MAQRRMVVGTAPVLIAQDNLARASISITQVPSAVESGNTGQVHLQKQSPPSATAGTPISGDVLTQGATISDIPQFPGDPSLFKGPWWAVADTAGQIIVVDETSS